MIHADISIGNSYRLARINLLIAIATGVFGFTVTFHKDLFGANLTSSTLWLIVVGWGLLLASMLAGVFHLRKWEDFYLTHRTVGNAVWSYRTALYPEEKNDAVKKYEKAQTKIEELGKGNRRWNLAQSGSLIVGMALLMIYVAMSGYEIVNVPPKSAVPVYAPCQSVAP